LIYPKTVELASIALILLTVGDLGAQERPPPLTMSEALELARENNPAYRRAVAEVEVAAADERRAWAALLPALSLNLSTGVTQSRVVTGTDEFGRPVRLEDPSIFTRTSTGQSLSIGSITLFDGGARLREARAVRASARATRIGVEAEAVRLEARIARAYHEAMRAERMIELEEALLASARERREATERLLRAAIRNPLDLAGAEVDVAQREQAVERARGESRKARLALAEAMGVSRPVERPMAAEMPPIFDPEGLDAELLVSEALERSPQLAQASTRSAAAGHRLRAARSARWPTVSISPFMSRGVGASGYAALFDLNPRDQSYGASFNVSLPIFNQFRTTHSVAQAHANVLGTEEELRGARLQVETGVRAALIDLQTAYRRVRLADRTAELSRQRVQMAHERYRLGGVTFFELQDVVDRAGDAEREALLARFEFATARVQLQEQAGVRLDGEG
jgi:outer membrane protein TolC